uniref:PD-(D/E)XK nuclease superfamily protein n=1 Tax=uncultured Thiotrichaceae bacterium TaxID=298394 RepID=A0A6S6TZK9_9GAMM|nr:MAG: PD-(D/E)XK nuclease superfamily protein [uncultured Thiotrichaceae bacterium]
MIKFPYGHSDFHSLRTEGYLYLDRTQHIAELEASGKQLIFLRPRRFGKSLLLSTLENYYDINRVEDFDTLFGDLDIGRNPTSEKNQYMVLRWDFSKVSAQGDTATIRHNLFDHINQTISGFQDDYQSQLRSTINITPHNAIASFDALAQAVASSGYKLYLLIDEYDNFANEVLMQVHNSSQQRYEELVQSEGILKTLFKSIKANASEGKIGRVFTTGISPVVLSDMTSGYNVATNIYLTPKFNALCGISHDELAEITTQVSKTCQQEDGLPATLDTLRTFYNGYRFCSDSQQDCVYNPTLVFYFLRDYQEYCSPPERILDGNLAMDAGKIRYIAGLPNGESIIRQIIDEQPALVLDALEDRFGVEALEDRFGVEALREMQSGQKFMLSLLYYFGVLTISGRSALGELAFGVPNLVIRSLYVEELRKRVLPDAQDGDKVQHLARDFYRTADLQPLAEFMENQYFRVFSNRGYRWSNELTIKTAFLTLLFNDNFYIMDSEPALARGYSDLTLIVRPNMRQYALQDIVLEFKYLSLADVGLSGEVVRGLSREEADRLPVVQAAIQGALVQLRQYRDVLVAKYQEPERLRCLAVVAIGFERVVWEELVVRTRMEEYAGFGLRNLI